MRSGGRLGRVADRAAVARRPLAGRAGEIAAVVGLVETAARGDGGALLVSGEAGVGKTALVREASAQVGRGRRRAVGAVSAVDVAGGAVPAVDHRRCAEWAAGRDVPVPVLGGSGEEGPAGFDAWLEALCRQRPVLLVVDDLQWADQSSLDVLMYVLAGLAGRRLAVVTTVRAGEEGEPLRRWLADVRRFPGVGELTLGRLDRVATGEQLAGLLGRPPHQSLVDDVYARSQGNAYLTTLLVRGLSPDARSLPAGLPTDLREAATRAWRGLSAPAQAADPTDRRRRPTATRGPTRASGGRDRRAAASGAAAARGGRRAPCSTSARTAPTGSSTRCSPRCWRPGCCPRNAQLCMPRSPPRWSPPESADEMGVEQVVDLADHHYRAGHSPEAYRWALLGAEAAEQAGGATEMLRLLRRALDLLAAGARSRPVQDRPAATHPSGRRAGRRAGGGAGRRR